MSDPETIKNALRRCDTLDRVDATAKLFGGVVADLIAAPATHTHGLHIKNLAAYMRLRIRNGWGPMIGREDAA